MAIRFILGVVFALSVGCASMAGVCPQRVEVLGLPPHPQAISIHTQPSQALRDPLVKEARKLKVVEDYKWLADLSARQISDLEKQRLFKKSKTIEYREGRKAAVWFLVSHLYEHKNELLEVNSPNLAPKWTVPDPEHKSTFAYIERTWKKLIRRTPEKTDSSLIPLPYPTMIAGDRFGESYYWDSFFAMPALLKTQRGEFVEMQIENFLFLLKEYGFIGNGTRDYYLSRSQPPLISQMVRLLLENEIADKGSLSKQRIRWLREHAYPLIRRDYLEFWMNPQTRYNSDIHLNHNYDSLNEPRPERHSTDNEEKLAQTYRDVRAEAESGEDFAASYDGQATQVAGVLLNSLLFQVEKNLAWMATLLHDVNDANQFEIAAQERAKAMNTYLWDEKTDSFRNYNFSSQKRSSVLSADTFVTLYTQLASPPQAQAMLKNLPLLEHEGGLASSDTRSGKQWDKPYGWAPHHFFTIAGFMKYPGAAFDQAARRLADKWIKTNDRIFQRTGKLVEKIDATTGDLPKEEGDKYPTQEGFLWTNGVYVWSLNEVLGVPLIRDISPH